MLLALLEWPRRHDGAGPSPWLRLSQGAGVLRKLNKEISECYRLADQAREWAEEATDPASGKITSAWNVAGWCLPRATTSRNG